MCKPEDEIGYAIIALNQNEARKIVDFLAQEDQTSANNELGKKLDSILEFNYGMDAEKWQPFGDEYLCEILRELNPCFKSKCATIKNIIEGTESDILRLQSSNIKLIFIDAFATYNPAYKTLATKIGDHIKNFTNCCMIIPDEFDSSTIKILDSYLQATWRPPYDASYLGKHHEIVHSLNRLYNFINMGFIDPQDKKLNSKTINKVLDVIKRDNERQSSKTPPSFS
ncbi:MAG: hypothetical protein GY839_06180 [candidate division Zixibacteria bacterium]|nr:hypothetical protein [candidate division Zixibacteria bacterium]